MTAHDGTARAAATGSPVLFIVDADPQARVVVESALARRSGLDYRVLAVGTPQDALRALTPPQHGLRSVRYRESRLRVSSFRGGSSHRREGT